jgi:hypothetical protein
LRSGGKENRSRPPSGLSRCPPLLPCSLRSHPLAWPARCRARKGGSSSHRSIPPSHKFARAAGSMMMLPLLSLRNHARLCFAALGTLLHRCIAALSCRGLFSTFCVEQDLCSVAGEPVASRHIQTPCMPSHPPASLWLRCLASPAASLTKPPIMCVCACVCVCVKFSVLTNACPLARRECHDCAASSLARRRTP